MLVQFIHQCYGNAAASGERHEESLNYDKERKSERHRVQYVPNIDPLPFRTEGLRFRKLFMDMLLGSVQKVECRTDASSQWVTERSVLCSLPHTN